MKQIIKKEEWEMKIKIAKIVFSITVALEFIIKIHLTKI